MRKIIFAFTDQEEGPPVGLFGQGAARLLNALPTHRAWDSSTSMVTMSTRH